MSEITDNAQGVTAVLGLVLLTQPNHEVLVPVEVVEMGLPEFSGVQVYHDEERDVLVVRIAHFGEEDADE